MDENAVKKAMVAINWEKQYRENLHHVDYFLEPLECLDPDFEKFLMDNAFTGGEALDIGSGTGEQAIFLAKRGIKVTATDVSATAIAKAERNAESHSVEVTCMVDNILLTRLAGAFDLIIDRGCYTLIPPPFKEDYMAAIRLLLKPDGVLLIKTDRKKGQRKPLTTNGTLETEITEGQAYRTLTGKIIPTYFFVVRKRGVKAID